VAEREVLGAIAYQENAAVLHTDIRLLPRRRRAWAAWNYHRDGSSTSGRVSVTYNLTRLQSLPTRRQILLTLNGEESVDPATIVHRQTYSHPVFDAGTLRAQGRRSEINGPHRTWFCGAYWGYGFHEDGVQSAIAVCNALDERRLLPPAPADFEASDAQLYLSGTR
jgi:predicted NAD/FAD-binding protein